MFTNTINLFKFKIIIYHYPFLKCLCEKIVKLPVTHDTNIYVFFVLITDYQQLYRILMYLSWIFCFTLSSITIYLIIKKNK